MLLRLRVWLIAGFLGTCAVAARAQTAPAVSAQLPTTAEPAASGAAPALLLSPTQVPGKYKTYLYQRYGTSKEASAAVHLFARKQTGGAVWLGAGALIIAFVASQTGTTSNSSGTTTVSVSPLGYGILLGLFGSVGVGKLARFSDQKLYQALLMYDQQKVWPSYVASRLKYRDTH